MTKKGIITLIAIFLIVFAVIFVSGFFMRVKPLPEDTIGNSAGNLYNGGLFDEDEGVVFFANPLDNYAMYSMNSDESDAKKIIESTTGLINAAGKYVFYYQGTMNSANLGFIGHNTGVYRSDKNGKNIVGLVREPANSVKLVGNFVYYEGFDDKEGLEIARVGIDKKNREILSNKVFDCSEYRDGRFYYAGVVDDHYLRTFDATSKTVGTVFEGNISCPVICGERIYYINNVDGYKLYSRALSGDAGTEMKLTDERVECFNIAAEKLIYYQVNDPEDPVLMRMTLDGSVREPVMRGNYVNINVTSQYVYFMLWGKGTPVLFHQNLSNGQVEQWVPPVL